MPAMRSNVLSLVEHKFRDVELMPDKLPFLRELQEAILQDVQLPQAVQLLVPMVTQAARTLPDAASRLGAVLDTLQPLMAHQAPSSYLDPRVGHHLWDLVAQCIATLEPSELLVRFVCWVCVQSGRAPHEPDALASVASCVARNLLCMIAHPHLLSGAVQALSAPQHLPVAQQSMLVQLLLDELVKTLPGAQHDAAVATLLYSTLQALCHTQHVLLISTLVQHQRAVLAFLANVYGTAETPAPALADLAGLLMQKCAATPSATADPFNVESTAEPAEVCLPPPKTAGTDGCDQWVLEPLPPINTAPFGTRRIGDSLELPLCWPDLVYETARARMGISPVVLANTQRTLLYLQQFHNKLNIHRQLLLEGETGVGKTAMFEYYGHITNQIVLRFNGSASTTHEELFGRVTNDPANRAVFGFAAGPALEAYMHGYYLLIDEANLMPEDVVQPLEMLFGERLLLNAFAKGMDLLPTVSALDARPPATAGGVGDVVICRHPNFRLVFAQNPPNERYAREVQSLNLLSTFTPLLVSWGDTPEMRRSEWQQIAKYAVGADVLSPELRDEVCCNLVAFHERVVDSAFRQRLLDCESTDAVMPEHPTYLVITIRELKRFSRAIRQFAGLSRPVTAHLCITLLTAIYGARMQSPSARALIHAAAADVFGVSVTEAGAPASADIKLSAYTVSIGEFILERREIEPLDLHELRLSDTVAAQVIAAYHSVLNMTTHQDFFFEFGLYDFLNQPTAALLRRLLPVDVLPPEDAILAACDRLWAGRVRAVGARRRLSEAVASAFGRSKVPPASTLHPDQELKALSPIHMSSSLLSALREVAVAHVLHTPLLLSGSAGSAKTTLLQALSVLTNTPFRMLYVSADTEISDILGLVKPELTADGKMLLEWHDGPLPLALKTGNIINFDNLLELKPTLLERLNSVLEERPTVLLAEKGDLAPLSQELISPFCFITACVQYRTPSLTPALANRFHMVCLRDDVPNDDLHAMAALLLGLPLPAPPPDSSVFATTAHALAEHTPALQLPRRAVWRFVNAAFQLSRAAVFADQPAQMRETSSMAEAARVVFASNPTVVDRLQQADIITSDLPAVDYVRFYTSAAPAVADHFVVDPDSTPNVYRNCNTVLRAWLTGLLVIFEGDPAVGKTSTITAMMSRVHHGQPPSRMTNSETTRASDYLGTWRTCGRAQFAFAEGPLITCIRDGRVFLNDETNLAYLTGLRQVFIPLCDMGTVSMPSGEVYHANLGFWLAGAQNPESFSGRKRLPASLVERVCVIPFDALDSSELYSIAAGRQVGGRGGSQDLLQRMCRVQAEMRTHKNLSRDPPLTIRELCRWFARVRGISSDNMNVASVTHALELLAGRSVAPLDLAACIFCHVLDLQAQFSPDLMDPVQQTVLALPQSTVEPPTFTIRPDVDSHCMVLSDATGMYQVAVPVPNVSLAYRNPLLDSPLLQNPRFAFDLFRLCRCYVQGESPLMIGPTSRKNLLIEILADITGRQVVKCLLGPDTTADDLLGRVLPTTITSLMDRLLRDLQLVQPLAKRALALSFEKELENIREGCRLLAATELGEQNVNHFFALIGASGPQQAADAGPAEVADALDFFADAQLVSTYQIDDSDEDSTTDDSDTGTETEDDGWSHVVDPDATEPMHPDPPSSRDPPTLGLQQQFSVASQIEHDMKRVARCEVFFATLALITEVLELFPPSRDPKARDRSELECLVDCCRHLVSSLHADSIRDDEDLARPTFKWVDGPVTAAVRRGSILLLDHIDKASASVVEHLNSLFELERELESSEYGLLVVPDCTFVACLVSAADGRRATECNISPALLSRLTTVALPAYRVSEFEPVVRARLAQRLPDRAELEVGKLANYICSASHLQRTQGAGEGCTDSKLALQWCRFVELNPENPLDGLLEGFAALLQPRLPPEVFERQTERLRSAFPSIQFDAYFQRACCEAGTHLLDEKNCAYKSDTLTLLRTSLTLPRYRAPVAKLALCPDPATNYNLYNLVRAMAVQLPVLLVGKASTGKSSAIAEVATAMGLQSSEITCLPISKSTTKEDLFGRYVQAVTGAFKFEPGPFPRACGQPGIVVLKNLHLASDEVLTELLRSEFMSVPNSSTAHIVATVPELEQLAPALSSLFCPVLVQPLLPETPSVDSVLPLVDFIFVPPLQPPPSWWAALMAKVAECFCKLVLAVKEAGDTGGLTFTPRDLHKVHALFDPVLAMFKGSAATPATDTTADLAALCPKVLQEVFSICFAHCFPAGATRNKHVQIIADVFQSPGLSDLNAAGAVDVTLDHCVRLGFLCIPKQHISPEQPSGGDAAQTLDTARYQLTPPDGLSLQHLALLLQSQRGVLLAGPTASGKRTVPLVLAYLTRQPIVEINLNKSTEIHDLIGQLRVELGQNRALRLLSQLGTDVAGAVRQSIFSHHSAPASPEVLRARLFSAQQLFSTLDQLRDLVKPDPTLPGLGDLMASSLDQLGILVRKAADWLGGALSDSMSKVVHQVRQLADRLDDLCFERADGLLAQAVRHGWWVLLRNVNFCPQDVLAQLSTLLGRWGHATAAFGLDYSVSPKFRLIMTYDPQRPGGARLDTSMQQHCPTLHFSAIDTVPEQFSSLLAGWLRAIGSTQHATYANLLAQLHWCARTHHADQRLSPSLTVNFRTMERTYLHFASRIQQGHGTFSNPVHLLLQCVHEFYASNLSREHARTLLDQMQRVIREHLHGATACAAPVLPGTIQRRHPDAALAARMRDHLWRLGRSLAALLLQQVDADPSAATMAISIAGRLDDIVIQSLYSVWLLLTGEDARAQRMAERHWLFPQPPEALADMRSALLAWCGAALPETSDGQCVAEIRAACDNIKTCFTNDQGLSTVLSLSNAHELVDLIENTWCSCLRHCAVASSVLLVSGSQGNEQVASLGHRVQALADLAQGWVHALREPFPRHNQGLVSCFENLFEENKALYARAGHALSHQEAVDLLLLLAKLETVLKTPLTQIRPWDRQLFASLGRGDLHESLQHFLSTIDRAVLKFRYLAASTACAMGCPSEHHQADLNACLQLTEEHWRRQQAALQLQTIPRQFHDFAVWEHQLAGLEVQLRGLQERIESDHDSATSLIRELRKELSETPIVDISPTLDEWLQRVHRALPRLRDFPTKLDLPGVPDNVQGRLDSLMDITDSLTAMHDQRALLQAEVQGLVAQVVNICRAGIGHARDATGIEETPLDDAAALQFTLQHLLDGRQAHNSAHVEVLLPLMVAQRAIEGAGLSFQPMMDLPDTLDQPCGGVMVCLPALRLGRVATLEVPQSGMYLVYPAVWEPRVQHLFEQSAANALSHSCHHHASVRDALLSLMNQIITPSLDFDGQLLAMERRFGLLFQQHRLRPAFAQKLRDASLTVEKANRALTDLFRVLQSVTPSMNLPDLCRKMRRVKELCQQLETQAGDGGSMANQFARGIDAFWHHVAQVAPESSFLLFCFLRQQAGRPAASQLLRACPLELRRTFEQLHAVHLVNRALDLPAEASSLPTNSTLVLAVTAVYDRATAGLATTAAALTSFTALVDQVAKLVVSSEAQDLLLAAVHELQRPLHDPTRDAGLAIQAKARVASVAAQIERILEPYRAEGLDRLAPPLQRVFQKACGVLDNLNAVKVENWEPADLDTIELRPKEIVTAFAAAQREHDMVKAREEFPLPKCSIEANPASELTRVLPSLKLFCDACDQISQARARQPITISHLEEMVAALESVQEPEVITAPARAIAAVLGELQQVPLQDAFRCLEFMQQVVYLSSSLTTVSDTWMFLSADEYALLFSPMLESADDWLVSDTACQYDASKMQLQLAGLAPHQTCQELLGKARDHVSMVLEEVGRVDLQEHVDAVDVELHQVEQRIKELDSRLKAQFDSQVRQELQGYYQRRVELQQRSGSRNKAQAFREMLRTLLNRAAEQVRTSGDVPSELLDALEKWPDGVRPTRALVATFRRLALMVRALRTQMLMSNLLQIVPPAMGIADMLSDLPPATNLASYSTSLRDLVLACEHSSLPFAQHVAAILAEIKLGSALPSALLEAADVRSASATLLQRAMEVVQSRRGRVDALDQACGEFLKAAASSKLRDRLDIVCDLVFLRALAVVCLRAHVGSFAELLAATADVCGASGGSTHLMTMYPSSGSHVTTLAMARLAVSQELLPGQQCEFWQDCWQELYGPAVFSAVLSSVQACEQVCTTAMVPEARQRLVLAIKSWATTKLRDLLCLPAVFDRLPRLVALEVEGRPNDDADVLVASLGLSYLLDLPNMFQALVVFENTLHHLWAPACIATQVLEQWASLVQGDSEAFLESVAVLKRHAGLPGRLGSALSLNESHMAAHVAILTAEVKPRIRALRDAVLEDLPRTLSASNGQAPSAHGSDLGLLMRSLVHHARNPAWVPQDLLSMLHEADALCKAHIPPEQLGCADTFVLVSAHDRNHASKRISKERASGWHHAREFVLLTEPELATTPIYAFHLYTGTPCAEFLPGKTPDSGDFGVELQKVLLRCPPARVESAVLPTFDCRTQLQFWKYRSSAVDHEARVQQQVDACLHHLDALEKRFDQVLANPAEQASKASPPKFASATYLRRSIYHLGQKERKGWDQVEHWMNQHEFDLLRVFQQIQALVNTWAACKHSLGLLSDLASRPPADDQHVQAYERQVDRLNVPDACKTDLSTLIRKAHRAYAAETQATQEVNQLNANVVQAQSRLTDRNIELLTINVLTELRARQPIIVLLGGVADPAVADKLDEHDGADADFEAAAAAAPSASPASVPVQFEPVLFLGRAAASQKRSVILRNMCAAPLRFSLTTESPGMFEHNFDTAAGSLALGAEDTVEFMFCAAAAGVASQSFQIHWSTVDDIVSGTVSLELQAQAVPPVLHLDQAVVKLDTVLKRNGFGVEEPLTLENRSPLPMLVALWAASNDSRAVTLSLGGSGPTSKVLLHPNSKREVRVVAHAGSAKFSELSAGRYTGSVHVYLSPHADTFQYEVPVELTLRSPRLSLTLLDSDGVPRAGGEHRDSIRDVLLPAIQLGDWCIFDLQLYNEGDASLTVRTSPSNLRDVALESILPAEVRLLPRERYPLRIALQTVKPGLVASFWYERPKVGSLLLTLETNDSHLPTVQLKVRVPYETPIPLLPTSVIKVQANYNSKTRMPELLEPFTVPLENLGNAPLAIYGATLGNADTRAHVQLPPGGRLELGPGSKTSVPIVLEPLSPESFRFELQLATNSKLTPTLTLSVELTVNVPQMEGPKHCVVNLGVCFGRCGFNIPVRNVGRLVLQVDVSLHSADGLKVSKKPTALQHLPPDSVLELVPRSAGAGVVVGLQLSKQLLVLDSEVLMGSITILSNVDQWKELLQASGSDLSPLAFSVHLALKTNEPGAQDHTRVWTLQGVALPPCALGSLAQVPRPVTMTQPSVPPRNAWLTGCAMALCVRDKESTGCPNDLFSDSDLVDPTFWHSFAGIERLLSLPAGQRVLLSEWHRFGPASSDVKGAVTAVCSGYHLGLSLLDLAPDVKVGHLVRFCLQPDTSPAELPGVHCNEAWNRIWQVAAGPHGEGTLQTIVRAVLPAGLAVLDAPDLRTSAIRRVHQLRDSSQLGLEHAERLEALFKADSMDEQIAALNLAPELRQQVCLVQGLLGWHELPPPNQILRLVELTMSFSGPAVQKGFEAALRAALNKALPETIAAPAVLSLCLERFRMESAVSGKVGPVMDAFDKFASTYTRPEGVMAALRLAFAVTDLAQTAKLHGVLSGKPAELAKSSDSVFACISDFLPQLTQVADPLPKDFIFRSLKALGSRMQNLGQPKNAPVLRALLTPGEKFATLRALQGAHQRELETLRQQALDPKGSFVSWVQGLRLFVKAEYLLMDKNDVGYPPFVTLLGLLEKLFKSLCSSQHASASLQCLEALTLLLDMREAGLLTKLTLNRSRKKGRWLLADPPKMTGAHVRFPVTMDLNEVALWLGQAVNHWSLDPDNKGVQLIARVLGTAQRFLKPNEVVPAVFYLVGLGLRPEEPTDTPVQHKALKPWFEALGKAMNAARALEEHREPREPELRTAFDVLRCLKDARLDKAAQLLLGSEASQSFLDGFRALCACLEPANLRDPKRVREGVIAAGGSPTEAWMVAHIADCVAHIQAAPPSSVLDRALARLRLLACCLENLTPVRSLAAPPDAPPLDDNLECAICLELLTDPVAVGGSWFCRTCISRWTQTNSTHPSTRAPLQPTDWMDTSLHPTVTKVKSMVEQHRSAVQQWWLTELLQHQRLPPADQLESLLARLQQQGLCPESACAPATTSAAAASPARVETLVPHAAAATGHEPGAPMSLDDVSGPLAAGDETDLVVDPAPAEVAEEVPSLQLTCGLDGVEVVAEMPDVHLRALDFMVGDGQPNVDKALELLNALTSDSNSMASTFRDRLARLCAPQAAIDIGSLAAVCNVQAQHFYEEFARMSADAQPQMVHDKVGVFREAFRSCLQTLTFSRGVLLKVARVDPALLEILQPVAVAALLQLKALLFDHRHVPNMMLGELHDITQHLSLEDLSQQMDDSFGWLSRLEHRAPEPAAAPAMEPDDASVVSPKRHRPVFRGEEELRSSQAMASALASFDGSHRGAAGDIAAEMDDTAGDSEHVSVAAAPDAHRYDLVKSSDRPAKLSIKLEDLAGRTFDEAAEPGVRTAGVIDHAKAARLLGAGQMRFGADTGETDGEAADAARSGVTRGPVMARITLTAEMIENIQKAQKHFDARLKMRPLGLTQGEVAAQAMPTAVMDDVSITDFVQSQYGQLVRAHEPIVARLVAELNACLVDAAKQAEIQLEIVVCVDNSLSMMGKRGNAAKQSLVVLMEAMRRLEQPLAILSFAGAGRPPRLLKGFDTLGLELQDAELVLLRLQFNDIGTATADGA